MPPAGRSVPRRLTALFRGLLRGLSPLLLKAIAVPKFAVIRFQSGFLAHLHEQTTVTDLAARCAQTAAMKFSAALCKGFQQRRSGVLKRLLNERVRSIT